MAMKSVVFSKSAETHPELSILRISIAGRYALGGMRYLSERFESGRFILVSEVASKLGFPGNYLAKIFQALARRGLLASRRGPNGGYRLARAPHLETLADILRVAQETAPMRECLLEPRLCTGDRSCLVHEKAVAAERSVIAALGALTLGELERRESK